jgi:RNA polymerase sigma-32 factor
LKHWSLVGVGTGPMQSKLFFRLHREKAKLAARLGNGEDLTAKLAETFGTTEERIRTMEQRIDARDSSLDAKAFRDGNTTVMDTLTDEGTGQEQKLMADEVQSLVHERVGEALTRLDEREQVIVHHRLIGGERQTLSEIGKTLGLSRERVRQLEQRVKTKLRRSLADLAPEGATFAEAA